MFDLFSFSDIIYSWAKITWTFLYEKHHEQLYCVVNKLLKGTDFMLQM